VANNKERHLYPAEIRLCSSSAKEWMTGQGHRKSGQTEKRSEREMTYVGENVLWGSRPKNDDVAREKSQGSEKLTRLEATIER